MRIIATKFNSNVERSNEGNRVIWNELRELRYGKTIEGDAGELEKGLGIIDETT